MLVTNFNISFSHTISIKEAKSYYKIDPLTVKGLLLIMSTNN